MKQRLSYSRLNIQRVENQRVKSFIDFEKYCLLTHLVLFLWFSSHVVAQQKTTVIVNHADSLVVRTIGDETIRELVGNVSMVQDNVHIKCDRAVHNLTRNSAELFGNVVIVQDTLSLNASQAFYFGDQRLATCDHGIVLKDGKVTLSAEVGNYKTSERVAYFQKKVQVEDSTTTIFANGLTYYRDSSKAVATQNVVIVSKTSNSTITGDSVIHYTKRNISFIPLNPRLWQIDSTVVRRDSISGKIDSLRLDTLTIVCKKMEAYRDSTSLYITRDSVEIVRDDLRGRCGEGKFYSKDSLVVLRFKPIIWYKENQLTGDSMTIQLAENRVRDLHAFGNSFAISKSKPTEKDTVYPPNRFDQSKGKTIFMQFKNDDIDSVIINNNAMRLYYLYDGRALNGVSIESGNRILLSFEDSKVKSIKTVGSVEGKYYPEKLVNEKEMSYNLDGFLWREDRPMKPGHPKKPILVSKTKIE